MYQYKELYTIDFSKVQHYLEMHFIIRQALDWPDYYGCNWDAFWDCLTDMTGRPVRIEIIGLDVIERKFDDAAEKMISILNRFKHYSKEFATDVEVSVVNGNIRTRIV